MLDLLIEAERSSQLLSHDQNTNRPNHQEPWCSCYWGRPQFLGRVSRTKLEGLWSVSEASLTTYALTLICALPKGHSVISRSTFFLHYPHPSFIPSPLPLPPKISGGPETLSIDLYPSIHSAEASTNPVRCCIWRGDVLGGGDISPTSRTPALVGPDATSVKRLRIEPWAHKISITEGTIFSLSVWNSFSCKSHVPVVGVFCLRVRQGQLLPDFISKEYVLQTSNYMSQWIITSYIRIDRRFTDSQKPFFYI